MISSVDCYTGTIDCKNCGETNFVQVVSEYSAQEEETFNDVVLGQKCCACGQVLSF